MVFVGSLSSEIKDGNDSDQAKSQISVEGRGGYDAFLVGGR